MNYLFIRAYQKDDYLARLCYESWMLSGYKGRVIFYSEKYNSKWIKGMGQLLEREYCNNFGGQLGANALLDGFRKLDFEDDDIIISCDADVIIQEDPLKYFNADLGGKGGMNEHGFVHISGQLMIIKGKTLNEILSDTPQQIYDRWNSMVAKNINVADDIFLSYSVHLLGDKKIVSDMGKWVHDKLYHLEPRIDWQQIIDETKIIKHGSSNI